jgi:hypothetical protein
VSEEAGSVTAVSGQRAERGELIAAEDHSDDLADVEGAIADLESDRYERGLFKGEAGAQRYTAMMTRLESRAEGLRGMPERPAQREVTLSQDTFRERWESLATDHERGDMLRRMGLRLYVRKDDDGSIKLREAISARAWLAGEEWPGAPRHRRSPGASPGPAAASLSGR